MTGNETGEKNDLVRKLVSVASKISLILDNIQENHTAEIVLEAS